MSKEEKVNSEQTGFEISDEVIDQLLKNYRKPEDLLASEGIIKQLTKRAIERNLAVRRATAAAAKDTR